ncbi:MAG: hypothetical protein IJZ93_07335 [Clostridia bacterium]|nr:hypothetical protein [Clostridia bacterium]
MKKLILLLFILVTFLVLTSCDNNESADESSLDTSNATSIEETTSSDETNTEDSSETSFEETSTVDETTTVNEEKNEYPDANVEDLKIITLPEGGYPLIDGGKYIGKDFEEFYNIHSSIGKYRIIKTYDEFASLVIKGEQLDQSIFDKNYVFVYFTYEEVELELRGFGGLRKEGENEVRLDSFHNAIVTEYNENPNVIRFLIIPKTDFDPNIPLTGDVYAFVSGQD